jgi:hypothetical protein
VAEIKVELVGKGDVIVITSPDLQKSLVLSDLQFLDIAKHLVAQAKGHPSSMVRYITIRSER